MSQYLDKDGASRIAENFLSKQAEQDAILKNLQFDLKEAEHALVKTIQGPAPLNIRALTRPLDDYLITGNTVQNGTPTPEAPVDVVGCGERTENLAPIISEDSGWRVGYLTNQGTYTNNNPRGEILSPMISLSGIGSFIISASNYFSPSMSTYYFNGATFISTQSATDYGGSVFDNFPSGATCFCFAIRTGYQTIDSVVNHGWRVMLNAGSTALPYEPYGFKLPLTVNGTEYPIYLGQVPTTRRIRKLVLTGDENWQKSSIYAGSFYSVFSDIRFNSIGFCSHLIFKTNSEYYEEGSFIISSMSLNMWFSQFDSASTVNDFKAYLADQYQNGTPVTVWHILATPETAIVNEPLHKIGDYADAISMAQTGVTLTTTKGFNTITTDTAVLPSNIEVKGVINNA